MFIGEYQHNIDQKGRMAVPVKFRKQVSGGAVITRGLDACLFVFTKDEWEKLAQKLSVLPLTQSNSRAFARLMFAGAHDVELDSQGRILVPDHLRTYAGLTKKVIVAGVFNRLEIWDSSKWGEYKNKTERDSGEIAEQLMELGI
ncbi:MAG: cell division/cell wall cluster transcriptional repressor MraZ [Candidatus Brennerbacteria bacterium CG11_big_fil_rev_8_21_14_0_20_43_10]|uniref:Transcriptional regulator MraZ n=3 Tax=Candidatus Brenneribacteriota TaxID=1817902 RepID=A0A2M8C3Q5_9BACT|nr:MAG: cell division/cell wall cluster transcriptional repressor MraZ [Parcubacteria group bacterium CG1_02_44_31]PIP50462.1 MAG: cell division/cell wall cluster transcriptional repressor MraZ [Candidatus Brennerbacteria bacterium CG23_combo_of_CG06-09_8_20_14_all_44_41]PIR26548.1 MAG: cell division/cell wall cluster transcriptional repressor MraZ [Candidatus Brennerbacteria bacterium CG11_big_fil_rev_8_21_14_0_20_43_10]PIX28925.1 MAG: cell division/cell wall cluster transcriptional repressor M